MYSLQALFFSHTHTQRHPTTQLLPATTAIGENTKLPKRTSTQSRGKSILGAALERNTNNSSFQKMLWTVIKLSPYRLQVVQRLHAEDSDAQVEICKSLMNKMSLISWKIVVQQRVYLSSIRPAEILDFFITLHLWCGIMYGAPPHWGLHVRGFLNQKFPDRWIGRDGPIPWPPRSPDITPLDFFLWGYVKDIVYRKKLRDITDLKQRMTDAIATIDEAMLQ
uniref:Uncharacterized protein n=1 Tax=Hippocampus comes TaxID=109280 RepID=A0A3Q2XIB6_HIPCM